MSACYRFENGLYLPLAPDVASGVVLAALLTREIERAPAPAVLRLARITLELPQVAPVGPIAAAARIVRDGKRQQLVEAELAAAGRSFAKAVGLRVSNGEGPSEPPLGAARAGSTPPCAVGDLVEGEAPSASARAVLACDMAATAANVVGTDWLARAVDLSVYFARDPAGDRLLVDARMEQYGEGYGLVSATLADEAGPFGFANQTVIYSRAPV